MKYHLELSFELPAGLPQEMCKNLAGTARKHVKDHFSGTFPPYLLAGR